MNRYSWRLGAAISKLVDEGKIIRPPIVVLIDNCVGDVGLPLVRRRHLEYGDGWWAEAYLTAVCDSLVPAVDQRFRTLPFASHRAQLGTSLGGQVAFLALWKRPDVFAGAACLSPAFQSNVLLEVAGPQGRQRCNALARSKDTRLYFDNGGDVRGGATVPLAEANDVVAAAAVMAGLELKRERLNPG